jgi:hypothetical protein
MGPYRPLHLSLESFSFLHLPASAALYIADCFRISTRLVDAS